MIFETPSLRGIAAGNMVSPKRVEVTPVSHGFFHPRNVKALHTSIRYAVYDNTGKVIDTQGDKQLHAIMQAVYEDGQDPTLESALVRGDTIQQIRALNQRVINRAVREIIAAMRQHAFYINDISNPVPAPLPRSKFADQKTGLKTLELPFGFGAPL